MFISPASSVPPVAENIETCVNVPDNALDPAPCPAAERATIMLTESIEAILDPEG